MKESNSFTDTIRSIIKWRKLLIITTLAAFVLSIVISLLLPVYYKSTEIFYPYSMESLDPKIILTETTPDVYGSQDDVDRLKQIGESGQLMTYMVKRFDLYKRYKIDTSDVRAPFMVTEEFKDNYQIIKNDKGAIEVSVLDQDPKMAARMTRAVANFIDSINLRPIYETNSYLLQALKSTLKSKQEALLSLDSAVHISALNKNASGIVSPKTIIESQKVGNIDALLSEKILAVINMNEKYNQMDKLLNSQLQSIFVIEEAYPAVVKHKPIRSLIVAASTLLTFFFTLALILLWEFYNSNIREMLRDE